MDDANIADRLGRRTPEYDETEPDRSDFDRYTDYEENGKTVICDRKNASAWVKSDTVAELEP